MDFLHATVAGLVQVFAWPTFGLMLLGMALGFVVGLLPLPGLGGPTVTATTGDITSILFRIPGEPTTAATIPPGQLLVWLGDGG